jgi:hypothetical protein
MLMLTLVLLLALFGPPRLTSKSRSMNTSKKS